MFILIPSYWKTPGIIWIYFLINYRYIINIIDYILLNSILLNHIYILATEELTAFAELIE